MIRYGSVETILYRVITAENLRILPFLYQTKLEGEIGKVPPLHTSLMLTTESTDTTFKSISRTFLRAMHLISISLL